MNASLLASSSPPAGAVTGRRFLGLDAGAETLKVVELVRTGTGPDATLRPVRRVLVEHHKDPAACLRRVLPDFQWETVTAAATCGRFSRCLRLPRVPVAQAQARAWRFRGDHDPVTLVSIGSHGFSVLELRRPGVEVFRENSRCSQGTGNFLRQLVERFSLTLEEACARPMPSFNPPRFPVAAR
jgi:hypothetical protein